MAVSDERSRIMRAVKSRNTKPELAVRHLVHSLGYRFRLHRSDLPGKPDLALPRYKSVVFVHGCFWHGHTCARGARAPVHNAAYWQRKIERNVARDRKNKILLRAAGWEILILWECELKNIHRLRRRIENFLGK